jgi:hypothetical protein
MAMVSVRDLQERYLLYLHTQLSGDPFAVEGVDFGLWLDAHWEDAPLGWDGCHYGAATAGPIARPVAWIESDEEIIGLLAGRPRGRYRIPVDAWLPEIALFLDDAPECSTGSVQQERAFAAVDVAVPMTAPVRLPAGKPAPLPVPVPAATAATLPQSTGDPALGPITG